MASQEPQKSGASRLLLLRGESIIAYVGVVIGTLLVVVFAAAGGWVVYAQREAARESTQAQVDGWAALLASTAWTMLREDQEPQLRATVVRFATEYELARCRVVLEDGRIVADSDPSRTLGGTGRKSELAAGGTVRADAVELVAASSPLGDPQNPGGRVEVAAGLKYPRWTGWEMQAGLGGIGALGLGAFLLVYRHLRSRLRAIGAIRESLLAMDRGEKSASVLTVDLRLGAEAQVWNALLADRERMQKELLGERARESIGARGDLKQDLVQACDALWQGLLLIDDDLKIKYANGAAAVYLRARREVLPGTSFGDYVKDPAVIESIRTVASGQVRRKTTLELRRSEAEGGGILRLSVRPVRRDDAAAAVVVVEDITQQRVADEARNAFVAQATHELRTPLTNIRLYVEQAIDLGEAEQAERAKCLNVINQEARRLERIVGDMLSVSEIEAGSFKLRSGDVRLDAVFEELTVDFRAQAEEKKVTLAFELPPKFPVIQGDRDKIMLALHNLLGNALKYTPEGGSVTVRVVADASQLLVDVVDTGIGIAPEESEMIFERFYRSNDKRLTGIAGTGLGLTLAREVVRLHGGDITVRSQVDQGSTFTLSLPLVAEAA